ncbi:hypothetical protein BGZ88_012252 [Linnemannia elongata]|nr:hypothetical protein BGZ88_012252 [Linnemannia elongata]
MSRKEEMQDQKSQLLKAYFKIVARPFQEKYEDMKEEEAYWEAVEDFKAESEKIGFEDPCEALNLTSFEAVRARLMAGPMLCFRKGWKSSFIGEEVDMLTLIVRFHHTSGPKFEGKERIVIIEFWATW